MMWVRLFGIMLCCVGSAVGAQAANETVAGLESCFKLVLRADSMCSNLANDAAQHMDCLEKARTAQLECLQRVPPERSAASVLSPASAKQAATATNLWVISETTSPVDYSPLITAVIRSSSADRHSMSWTTHRTRCSYGGSLARVARRRYSSCPSNQRPTPRQADLDCFRGRQHRELQEGFGRIFAIASGRGATEDQRARRLGSRPLSDVPTCRIGCGPGQDCGAMQVAAARNQNQYVIGSAIDRDRLVRTLLRFI